MERKKYIKTYVKLSEDIVKKLDIISNKIGMPKSSLIAYYVGIGLFDDENRCELSQEKDKLIDPSY